MWEKPDSCLVVLWLKPNQQQLPIRTAQGFPKSRHPDSSHRQRRKIASLSALKPFSGLARKSSQIPLEMAQCSRHNYQPLNLTALFRTNSESLILFETAPAATFLPRQPLHCSSNYYSCIGNHLPAPAATSSAPAATSPAPVTFLQQHLPVLHQQLPVLHQQPLSCTSDHLPATADTSSAPATTSPEPVTTFLHQQTPATTSTESATTFLHQQIPATTSPAPATTFLHQHIPVLNQQPSSCTSGNQSCTSDYLSNKYQSCTSYPNLLQRLPSSRGGYSPYTFFDLRFTIIKFGLSKQHPCFVILA